MTLGSKTLRRKPVQERSRRIRTSIMEAAHAVMRERGVRAVTTNAIAERADIKVGSIYDYFANKEAVIAELYAEKLADVRGFLEVEALRVTRELWRSDVGDLVRGMWTYQLSIGLDRTLVDAAYFYEDLLGIARTHSLLFASTFAQLLRRLGSPWSDEALIDLGISLYTLVNATWSYWRLTETDRSVAIERQIQATVALMGTALAALAPQDFRATPVLRVHLQADDSRDSLP
ncbi:MAG: TetR/AcrR family transcriptional regulator [Janthinobacterium lividum]